MKIFKKTNIYLFVLRVQVIYKTKIAVRSQMALFGVFMVVQLQLG